MAISAPVIVLPSGGADYATDTVTQTLSGTVSPAAVQIRVNGSTIGVSYTPESSVWSWTGDMQIGVNTLQFVAVDKATGTLSSPTIINVTLIQNTVFTTVSAPTGVRLRRYQDKVEIINVQNPESQVIGYNYYVYTQSGGQNNAYAKINPQYVTNYSFYQDITTEVNRKVDVSGNIQVTTITDEVDRQFYYSYFFDQTAFNTLVSQGLLPAVTFNSDTPFFFVITAIIYDSVLGQVSESSYSVELQGSPLTIITSTVALPQRTQNDILLTYSQELITGNQSVDTKPSTVLRDILNPISEDEARLYVTQDFLARCLSVSALLGFDDANGDGISDPVATSIGKTALQIALNLSDPNQVQTIIDTQFDNLASNVNVIRKGAASAVGTAIFYTTVPPIRDMQVLAGGIVATVGDPDNGTMAQQYRLLSSMTLDYLNRDAYYNPETKQYELSVPVQAITPGSLGNTDSYTVTVIGSGADSDFSVENPNPISFGEDEESNSELADRIELAFFADTGTEGGYVKTAVGVTGVHGVRVEAAGDDLMHRDWDSLRNEHVGGKVDIYVQGDLEAQKTDVIAFSFQGGPTGEVFSIVNVADMEFKTKNPQVTSTTPIFEVTKVYNSTRAASYDLTNYQIIGEGTIVQLDITRPVNVATGLAAADVIRVDYNYRSTNTFVLANQPVTSVTSVTGQLSGELGPDNWELVKLQDPLIDGGSTISQDSVMIKFANNLPVTGFQSITNEAHVIIIETDENLNVLGADPNSILITNQASTVIYKESVDYTVNPGTYTKATTFKALQTGSIINGSTVLVNYSAIENFSIVYVTNSLLQTVQTQIDDMKHACADAVVKQAVENSVDFVFTVIPKAGVTNTSYLTAQLRTAVANYISQLGIGVSLTQSDVVSVISGVGSVDYVILPFLRMVKADGSLIIRDDIGQVHFSIFNQGAVTAYVTSAPVLSYSTSDNGGPSNLFRAVFENNVALALQSDPLDVSGGVGRAYIRADGHIIVSTADGSLPDGKDYQLTYYVSGETGSKDIDVASIEYLTVGNFSVTYDQPRQISKQTL